MSKQNELLQMITKKQSVQIFFGGNLLGFEPKGERVTVFLNP